MATCSLKIGRGKEFMLLLQQLVDLPLPPLIPRRFAPIFTSFRKPAPLGVCLMACT
jgi:hypothetical protein